MSKENFFIDYFNLTHLNIISIDNAILLSAVKFITDAGKEGNKIIVAGNGGSAAMASHFSVDLTKTAEIRSVNFNESDLITCFANDYGYENWVSKALEYYADPGDVVILISSSGKSLNILNAAKRAKELGLKTITLSGFKSENKLRCMGDLNLWTDSNSYNIVEMTHHIWLLAIVDFIIQEKKRSEPRR